MKTATLVLITAATLAAQAPDFSKVEIKTTKLAPNFYVLEGAGGATGVLTGPDGVLMVDSQFAPLTNKLVAAIHQISSNAPIRFLINTHQHGDHTGGNENLGKMGVIILSTNDLRARLTRPVTVATPGNPVRPAYPATALPTMTYAGQITLNMDGEEVRAIPVPRGHTGGDTLVYFPVSDVLMTGDFYRSVGYPTIDVANGGSSQGMINGLGVAIGFADANSKIVPGHGPVATRDDLIFHRDMYLTVRDRVLKMIREGKTEAEVTASKPTADFDAKVPSANTTADRFVGQLYNDLKRAN